MIQPNNNHISLGQKWLGPGNRAWIWLIVLFACCFWTAPALGVSAPTGVTGTTSAATPAIISWNSVSGATSYKVYRGTTSGGETSLATGIATTSYNDTTATRGTTYYYTVYAVSFVTPSSASSEVIVDPINTSSPYFQINAGGPTSSPFAADAYYTPSQVYSTGNAINVTAVNAASQTVYQTERNSVGGGNSGGPVTYTLPGLTPSGSYVVRLHFSESSWSAANQRLFNVAINGTTVLSQFDVYLAAAAEYKAVVRNFSATADASGNITIVFSNGTADQLEINGIEILSGSVTAAPTGLAAAQASATSASLTWGSVAGATSYNLYRSTTASYEGSTPYQTGLASASYTDTGLTSGTTYYYKVVAVNAQGESAQSSEVSLTPVAAPTGLAVTLASATSSTVTWTAVAGATSYNLYRGTTAGGEGNTPVQTGLTGTSYTNTGLTSGTTYYYKLSAVSATAESALSVEVKFTPVAAPTGLAVTEASATSSTLTWTAVTGATSYKLYRSTTAGGEGNTPIQTGITGTSYTNTALTTNTTYYYTLAAVNPTSTSAQSSEVNITLLAAPTGLAATEASTTSSTLTWTAVTGATSYNLYRSTASGGEGSTPIQTGLTGTSYTNTGLTTNTLYYYKLTAVNATAESLQSTEISIKPIAIPTGVAASQASATSSTVTWTAVSGATSYNLYRSTTSGGEGSTPVQTGLTGTSYTNTGLTSGATYYYTLTAVNPTSESPQSAEFSVAFIGAPSGLAVTQASATSSTLTWTAVTGATSYNLYRSTTAGGEGSTPVQTGLTGTSYTNTGLTSGTPYYYTLTAVNAVAESNQSSEVSLTPLASPTGVAATPGNAQVALTWTASTGATSYNILRSTTSGSGYTQVGTSPTVSYTDSTAANNTTYFYVVQAVSAGGTSSNSSEVAATPGGANGLLGWWKLDEDTGSAASDSSGFSNNGTFSSAGWAAGRSGYAGSFNGSSSEIDMGKGLIATANSYTVACWVKLNSLTGNQNFIGQDGVTDSNIYLMYNAASAKFAMVSPPSDAMNVGGIYAYSTTTPVTGTWYHLIGVYDAVNNQLKIYVNGALQGTTSYTTPWSATGNTVVGRAKYNGAPDDWVNGLIDDPRVYNRLLTAGEIATISAYPTSVTATQATATSATISWTAFPNAISYNLYRSTTAGGEGGTAVATGFTGTSYTNTGLTSGTTYYYKLSATTASGESAQSDEVSLTPLASPTGVAATPGNAQVALTWTASVGATSYNILRSTTSGSGYTQVGTSATVSYTDSTVANNTTYFYVVQAVSAGGTSSNSSEVAATPGGANGLLGWWKLDEDTGSAASDSSGFSNNGTFSSAGWAAGRSGYAGSFNGSSSEIDMGKGLIATANSYTVACWVKLNSLTGNQNFIGQDGVTDSNIYLMYNAASAKFAMVSPPSDAMNVGGIYAYSTTTPVTGTWYHLIGVYDAVNNQLKIYVNGALQGTTSYTTPWSATGNTVVGRAKYNGAPDDWVNGLIDDPRVYNRLLTAGEIATISAYPTSVTATQATATSATISWTAFPNAISYNLYRSTTAGGEGGTAVATGFTGTSYTNTGLTSGTTYYYKLSATTASGESAQSDETTVTPVAAPTSLAVTEASTTSSTLTWAAVTGATSYNLYRSTTTGGEGSTPIQTGLTGTSYTNTGLSTNTTYYYKLTAVTATSESAQSSEVSLTPVAAPTGLAVTQASATSSTVTWTAVTGATSYNLYRSTTAGGEGNTPVQTGLTGTSYTNTGLTSGTTYYYKLTAVIATTESALSSEVSFTPISAPTALSAVPGNTSVTLSWAAVTGATSYNILRSTTSGTGYVAVTGGTGVAGTSFTDPTGGAALTNGTTYYYVVTASSSGSTSSYSAEAAVTPAAPTLLLVKRITAINGVAISGFVSDGAGNDTNVFWPSPSSTYLRGGLAATAKPGDNVEYTIYFLAIGSGGVTSVVVSNLLPGHVNFNATAYNGLTPTDGGSGNSGLALALSSVSYPSAPTVYLSNASDSDRGAYYAAGVAVAGICTAVQNINGVVVVNVVSSPTTLPATTAVSSPYNSYGFIRYQVTIR